MMIDLFVNLMLATTGVTYSWIIASAAKKIAEEYSNEDD